MAGEIRLHKKDIAARQIETALELFFAGGDGLSISTLAGAGEAILGALLRRTGKVCMMDHLLDLDKCLTGGRDPKIVNEEVNGIRNSLKHANKPVEDEVQFDPEEFAIAMLSRAVDNYVCLFDSFTPLMQRFFEYCQALHPDVGPTPTAYETIEIENEKS